MSPNKTVPVPMVVGIVVAVALVVGGATYVLANARTARDAEELENRVGELEQQAQEAEDATVPEQTEDATPATESENPKSTTDDKGAERQFAFIDGMSEAGGRITVRLDYAQFLTGDAAAQAATDAGEESPPPNDYFLVNSNKRIRSFTVDPAARFVIALDTPEDTRDLNAGEFFDAFVNDTDQVIDAAYWVTISGGKLTAAEEQWLP